MSGEIVVALDIGSTKARALIGETAPGGAVQIIGAGAAPCTGLRRGVVVDLASTVRSIKECVQKASRQAQVEAHRVTAGISGEHIQSETVTARVVAADPNGIMLVDINRVVEQAQARFISPDRLVLSVEPIFFTVDGRSGIRKPVGMIGKNLEAEVHVVTADRSSAETLRKAIELADLSVEEEDGLIFNGFASARSTLTLEERQVGVAIADIGGGVTDLAVYHRDEIRYSAVIPVGGGHVTQDLSLGLQISEEEAERLKLEYGLTAVRTDNDEEIVDIHRPGSDEPMPIPRKLLTQIIEPRMEELFELILENVKKSGLEKPGAGIVLTGGGALLPGALAIAERSFGGLEARLGLPRCAGGIADSVAKPPFASTVGLMMIASKRCATDPHEMDDESLLHPVKKGLGRWLRGLFGGR